MTMTARGEQAQRNEMKFLIMVWFSFCYGRKIDKVKKNLATIGEITLTLTMLPDCRYQQLKMVVFRRFMIGFQFIFQILFNRFPQDFRKSVQIFFDWCHDISTLFNLIFSKFW